MKYLLQAISARRGDVQLPDPDLRQLLMDVRKGRDEKEEFFEAIERIITELRNYTEHSGPFLTRVSKREAPDYYDVITNPMDLGTMLKKLRNNGYRNKKQFAHDLDLIWENCLVYNSDPAHPLRRNVHFMRKKANHLLEFVSDKSDVKDALSQWEANDQANALRNSSISSNQLNGNQSFGENQYSSPNLAGLTPFSRRPTGLNLSIGSSSAAAMEKKAKAKSLKLAKLKKKKAREKARKKKRQRIVDSDGDEETGEKERGKGKEKTKASSDDGDDFEKMDLDDDDDNEDDDDDDDLDLDDDEDDDDDDDDLQAEAEGEEGEVPFEQRPAIVRTREAMQVFNNLDWGLAREEEEEEDQGLSETSRRNQKESKPEVGLTLSLIKELGGNGRAGPLRAALIASTSSLTSSISSLASSDDENQKQFSSKESKSKFDLTDTSATPSSSSNIKSEKEKDKKPSGPTFFDLERGDSSSSLSWWAALSNDQLSAGALPNLKGSELVPFESIRESEGSNWNTFSSSLKGKEKERPAKKRMITSSSSSATISPLDFKNSPINPRQNANGISNSSSNSSSIPVATPDSALPKRLALARSRAGLRGMIIENVRTIGKVKRTHVKFGKLSQVANLNPNDNDEENFASLLPSSEGETEDEELDRNSDLESEWTFDNPNPSLFPTSNHLNQKVSSVKDSDKSKSKIEWRNPYSVLTTESATETVRGSVQTLLAHKGFDASHSAPVDVLTGAAAEYMMNLGRTLRLYSDRYSHKMSAEEIILHTLHENSAADVAALESYIRDDVERHGSKMTDLLRKLRASYKERRKVHSEKAAAVEEAAFGDGADTFASGLFTYATGEDFFGFNSMGLSDELGVDNLQVPSRLWYGRNKSNRTGGNGGIGNHGNGFNNNSDQFMPPPPFIPLSSSAISAQIGLLKPFYREKIRRKQDSGMELPSQEIENQGQGQGQGQGGSGSRSGEPSETEKEKKASEEIEGKVEEEKKISIVLEDEEQGKQRYKVPPTGKMPSIGAFDPVESELPKSNKGVGRGKGRGRGKKRKVEGVE